jgi:hypothetical protein
MNGDSTAREIRREKVYVQPLMRPRDLMKKYGLKNSQACRASKRGWFVKNYSTKQVIVDPSRYDPDIAYTIARKIYRQNFSRNPLGFSLRDDLIQEAVTRMYELSGRYEENEKYSTNYHFHWVAHNAMQSFLKTWERQMKYSKVWEEYIHPLRRDQKRCYHPDLGWLNC